MLLRQDNADLRLTDIGYEVGLVTEERYSAFNKKRAEIEAEVERLKNLQITNKKEINDFLESKKSAPLKKPTSLYELIKRSELDYYNVAEIDLDRKQLSDQVTEQVNIMAKYEGYITKQLEQINQFKKYENKIIPSELDYSTIKGLRTEAIQKLNNIRPTNIGQASRISGVSPADITVLLIFLEQQKRSEIVGN